MSQYNRYGSMVQEYQVARVRVFDQARRERIEALHTREDALKYQRQVYRALKHCFGPMPVRTPLTPKVTGVVERETYRIEKVMFQSRPGLWVTANVYVPKVTDGRKKFPAVLCACGHSSEGKTLYQMVGRTLAHQGFVCMIYDPIGQGERHQYLQEGKYCGPTCEHQIAGNAMSLLGDFFGTWRAWDGIRALDYLLARPDVDKRHVGMTGNSGGGTLTSYISMLDSRITMAAPSCLGSAYLSNLENELPADSEQNPPGAISSLLNYADFFIAQAPRPTIILAAKDDFFDIRGLDAIHQDVQKVFGLMGKKSLSRIHRGQGPHGFSPELREAMCRFFREMVGYEPGYSEPAGDLEDDKTLWASPKGQVSHLPGARRVHDFTVTKARELARTRKSASESVTGKNIQRVLRKLLTLPKHQSAPHYRVLRGRAQEGPNKHRMFRWALETEPGILAILQARTLDTQTYIAQIPVKEGMSLYLPHLDGDQDAAQGHVTLNQHMTLTLDVRGIGETRSLACDAESEFLARYNADFFHAVHHQMMGESYLGRRVHDALATLDLLASLGGDAIHLQGRGLGGIIAAMAGVLHPAVSRVSIKHVPRSFHELTQVPIQAWPLSTLPWGVLKTTDLPEIYTYLRRIKKLKLTEPWDAFMKPVGKKR